MRVTDPAEITVYSWYIIWEQEELKRSGEKVFTPQSIVERL